VDLPQASHNASCVFTVRVNKSAYHQQNPRGVIWEDPMEGSHKVKFFRYKAVPKYYRSLNSCLHF
jgi:hypothetical protein